MSDASGMSEIHPGTIPGADQVADRLAILNVLGRYGSYGNEADLDGQATLFADDATFEIVHPVGSFLCDKATFVAGERHIFAVYRERMLDPSTGERRLFYLTNQHIRAQTASSADVSMMLLIVRIQPEGPIPHIESTGIYHGTLVKRGDRWLIHRWRVRTDRMPEPLLDEPAHPEAAWEQ